MSLVVPNGPQRIVCLTEEPTEILYALGEGERVVGISAYTERPPEAKRDKPVVSAFIGGSVDKISALKPDLIIGFSDIQAELAKKLISANLPVLIFNQRSVQEILDVIVSIGNLVGRGNEARDLSASYVAKLAAVAEIPRSHRPGVYFEEWDEPAICGIQWVSELIEIAGGRDVFRDRSHGKLAKDRFVSSEEVVAAAPEVVLASWCGKAFDKSAFVARAGFEQLPAVQSGQVFEIAPEIILQPGPASLTDGLDALVAAIHG
ncbi:MAG TPA: cobalamin-binding protein [Myxococcales bacterium]|nr:cobalamin-binding protein [Myxococcales bacterium]